MIVQRLSQSHRRRVLAPAGPWWDPLNEGLACVEAQSPEGAASLADSYIDLTGTENDVTVGVVPTWDSVNGWKFTAAQYLISPVQMPSQAFSVIAKISNFTSGYMTAFGFNRSTGFRLWLERAWSAAEYAWRFNWTNSSRSTGQVSYNSGVFAIAGSPEGSHAFGYHDGEQAVDSLAWVPAGAGTGNLNCYIGGRNDDGVMAVGAAVYVQKFAVYLQDLSGVQVAAISNAMG